jgi:uncharacterized protein (DUF885 family)
VTAATAGVTDPALADLLVRQWDFNLHEDPVWATQLGDHRFDDQLPDLSWAHVQKRLGVVDGFAAEAKTLSARTLSPSDQRILSNFVSMLQSDQADEVCQFELWDTNAAHENPISTWSSLPDQHPVVTVADGKNLVARYQAMGPWIDNETADLELGAKQGLYATAESLKRVQGVVDAALAAPDDKWDLYRPIVADHPEWAPGDLETYRAALTAALDQDIRPAVQRYRDALVKDLLPHARSDDQPGLASLPNGAACYTAMIQGMTTLPLTPEALAKTGTDEVARTDKALEDVGQTLFKTSDLPTILKRLRTDPTLRFKDAADVAATGEKDVTKAKAAIPNYFGLMPKYAMEIRPVPDAEAPFAPFAYYHSPNVEGTLPGIVYINEYQPDTKPRCDFAATVFHEGIPGHHMQIAIAMDLAQPAFLRYGGNDAYTEGWGLYAEQLADEMGLYDGPLDEAGRYSLDAFRSARLVVDTGLHAFGWSRQKAIDYMTAHTAKADVDIANEIDRYIAWPGQALGYKVGEMQILTLRQEAKDALGDRFDITGFHDVVLGGGPVTMDTLADEVHDWVAATKSGK